ncbi:hypothetical protein BGZ89_001866 [Linnemannia elongata]|nr:hypothetical protein BGZ89_001866 [Linnemannia elongata]
MPDPTKTAAGAGMGKKEGRKAHSRDSSQQSVLSLLIQDKPKKKDANTAETAKKQKTEGKDSKRVDEDEKLGEDWDMVEKKWAWETQKSNDQLTGAIDPESSTAAVASPKELPSSTQQKQVQRQSSMPNIKTATLKRLLTTTKASTTTTSDSSSKSKSSSTTDLTTSSAPSYISSTITSLTRQWLTLQSSPPSTHTMSAYTYWWGYEIYVPHKCMDTIERVSNTSQIFFGFLSGTLSAVPGLAALVPIAKIISAWVGYQWAVIKTQDAGKGVVISATWVLPVALASRPWDHCGHEDDTFPGESSLLPSPKKTLKSKLGLA